MSTSRHTYRTAIVDLRAQGLDDQQIAKELKITIHAVETISKLIADAEKRVKKRRHPPAPERTVTFRHAIFNAALPHARRRNMSVPDLLQKLVSVTIAEDMVDNVLDDLEAAC